MVVARQLGGRWTIGHMSTRGFEALRLSIWGTWKLFGPQAAYVVCYHLLLLDQARTRTGSLPEGIIWHEATHEMPPLLQTHMAAGVAEGAGRKFAPSRYFPERYELALDNACIL